MYILFEMGSFGRSFQLVKESFRVLMRDKSILVFPLLSAAVLISIYGGLVASLYFYYGGIDQVLEFFRGITHGNYLTLAIWIPLVLVSFFVAKFFDAAMMTSAYISLKGGNSKVSDGIENSVKHLGTIFKWSIVSFLVNWVLSAISRKAGIVGAIVTWVARIAWELVTMFVLPVIIFEHVGIRESIPKSAQLFKRTWGENLVGQFSIGTVLAIFIFLGLSIFVGLVALVMSSGLSLGLGFLFVPLGIFLIYLLIVGVVSSALGSIFSTALYIYATTGQVPSAFSPDLIKDAFKPKSSKKILSKSEEEASKGDTGEQWDRLRQKYNK